MATQLDLQEQEQIDALRAFWNRYGNLITWALVVVMASFAAWSGWQAYQRRQAEQAGVLFDELERAVQGGDLDKVARVFADLKDRAGSSTFVFQGALLTAKVQSEKGKSDDARAVLSWTVDKAGDEEIRAVAGLRLAGLLLDAKKYDEALVTLDAVKSAEFQALVGDRRGDVLSGMGKKPEAVAAYQAAWKGLPESADYRRLVEAKLTALGAAPDAPAGTPQ